MSPTKRARAAEETQRGAEQAWRWQSRPSITIVENTLELADLDPLVRELQKTFVEVQIVRRIAGPAAGGLFPDAALYLALGGAAVAGAAAAQGFFSELGKDAYRGLRRALFDVYRRAKAWTNGRGYAPITIETARHGDDVVLFIFPSGLDAERFDEVLLKLAELHPAAISRPPTGMMSTWMRWEDSLGEWVSQSW